MLCYLHRILNLFSPTLGHFSIAPSTCLCSFDPASECSLLNLHTADSTKQDKKIQPFLQGIMLNFVGILDCQDIWEPEREPSGALRAWVTLSFNLLLKNPLSTRAWGCETEELNLPMEEEKEADGHQC